MEGSALDSVHYLVIERFHDGDPAPVYGASANRDSWWDNSKAAHLGWTPRDSAERFRARIESQPQPAPDDPLRTYQGGSFVKLGPFEPNW